MAKQAWQVGQTVNLGGRQLLVMGRGDKRAKGEAAPWLLETGDGQRAYEWVPFRGLKLVRGDLVRPARAARRRKQRAEAKAGKVGRVQTMTQVAPKGGLFRRLLARFGRRVKPPSDVTITRPPGADIRGQPGQG